MNRKHATGKHATAAAADFADAQRIAANCAANARASGEPSCGGAAFPLLLALSLTLVIGCRA